MIGPKRLKGYDYIIVAFSGGKDSMACVLNLLKLGVPVEKIELWHHLIDGNDPKDHLMDWEVTPDYCRKFAAALGIKIYFSWKHGGFKREMLRDKVLTAPVEFEVPEGGTKVVGGKRGKLGYRMQFPQTSADLSCRWCSAYLKIDVAKMALNNQMRFRGKRTLFITGERAAESRSPDSGRALYPVFEPHAADLRDGQRYQRHIDHWRPVHKWSERQVWNIIKKNGIVPHPCYRMAWGRLSCATCIFGNHNQWASYNFLKPDRVTAIINYEKRFGKTINRTASVEMMLETGKVYKATRDNTNPARQLWDSPEYTGEILIDPKDWKLPAGAFGESAGPI